MITTLKGKVADWAYAFGWTVVRKLPEPLVKMAFTALADRMWRRRGRRVGQLEKNLSRVLGKPVAGTADAAAGPAAEVDEEVRLLSRQVLRSYFRYWLEVFRLPEMSRERIVSRMHIADYDKLLEAFKSGRGVIIALPHMGNYDHAGAWLVFQGHPFTTVAERLQPASLFDRFVAFRESLGMEVLPHTGGGAFGTMARRLRAGGTVCLVVDRDLTESGIDVEFFGKTARMPSAAAALAVQTGAVLLPVTLWYEGDNWEARIHDEIPVPDGGERHGKVQAMTQRLAREFERGIAEHPQDWHMLQRVWLEDLEDR
ncbi:MAG TPA: phosphatidylinositol mannoside acyltransferase [Streptosporangiaceae bacterium]|nr:phosphatidylinositol mannoside acyltransferase [Streptosporangiaceae bacterium]